MDAVEEANSLALVHSAILHRRCLEHIPAILEECIWYFKQPREVGADCHAFSDRNGTLQSHVEARRCAPSVARCNSMDGGCDIVLVLDRGGCDLPLAEDEVIFIPDCCRLSVQALAPVDQTAVLGYVVKPKQ